MHRDRPSASFNEEFVKPALSIRVLGVRFDCSSVPGVYKACLWNMPCVLPSILLQLHSNSSRYLLTKQCRKGNPPCGNRHKIVYCSVCTAELDFSAVFIKKMMTKFSSGLRKTCGQTWKSQCICNWKCASDSFFCHCVVSAVVNSWKLR